MNDRGFLTTTAVRHHLIASGFQIEGSHWRFWINRKTSARATITGRERAWEISYNG